MVTFRETSFSYLSGGAFGDWTDDLAKQAGVDKYLNLARKTADAATSSNPLRAAITSVEIRTALSAPIVMDADAIWAAAHAPSDPNATWKNLAGRLRPTIILNTPFGSRTVAPFGEASATEWKGNILKILGIALGALGLYAAGGFYLGKKYGERKAMREMQTLKLSTHRRTT